ncbi:MAG: mechanosensitive ion channel family protein [Candidatus Obscuribacterales bacterium]
MHDLQVKIHRFWKIVTHIWTHGFMGVDVGRILTSLAIFVAFMAFRSLFTSLVLKTLRKWVSKSDTELDDRLLDSLEDPIRFVPVVLGVFFALDYLHLGGDVDKLGDHAIMTLVTFNIFWALVRVVDPLSFLMKKLERLFTPAMVQWLIKAIKMALILVGSAAVLETWGIKVGPLVAGLGLFGVAVALGAQDMFKNLIGGLLVIAEKRFHPGDWIKVDGIVEGTVEDIGFRSTMIRRFDKAPVFVPNSKLADNAVTNFTQMTHRRIYWTIGIEFGATVEQLRRIRDGLEKYIHESDEFAPPDEVSTFIRIDSFSDSSIDMMLYCFTRTTDWGEWLEIKERLACKVKEIVEGAGSAFAFPSQSVYVEALPEGNPEIFVPPASK